MKLMEKKLPDCVSGLKYDDIKDKGKFWYDSGAEQWADEYISALEDHTQWKQELFRELFPDEDHTKYVCSAPGAKCDTGLKCGKFSSTELLVRDMGLIYCADDFNRIGKGGLFYLFVSTTNFHAFFSQLPIEIGTILSIISEKQLKRMGDLLELGAEQKREPFDIVSIMSAAFGIASTIAAPAPAPVGGAFAGVSGVLSLVSAASENE